MTLVSGFDPTVPRASGIRTYVLSLARELVALKQEVTILGLGSKVDRIDGAEFVPVTSRIRNYADFVLALVRFLRRQRDFDGVVHAQRPDDLLAFHLRTAELPKVVTLHGVHGLHVAARRGSLAAWTYGMAERYSLARTDALLCVSPSTLDHFRNRYPGIASNLHLLSAGIDMKVFHPRDRAEARERIGISIDDRLAVYVGRFEPEKNPLSIVDQHFAMKKRHPESQLLMIGGGQMHDSLVKRAASSQGTAKIIAPVAQQELAWYLCAADALVIASRHEGLPTVAMEAMACGIPVVGTRVGILPEIVKPGISGYLVDSPTDLGEWLEKALYRTRWDAEKCSEAVRMFGWDRVAPAILGIYRQVSA